MAGELNGLKSEGVVYKYVNIKLSKNNNNNNNLYLFSHALMCSFSSR